MRRSGISAVPGAQRCGLSSDLVSGRLTYSAVPGQAGGPSRLPGHPVRRDVRRRRGGFRFSTFGHRWDERGSPNPARSQIGKARRARFVPCASRLRRRARAPMRARGLRDLRHPRHDPRYASVMLASRWRARLRAGSRAFAPSSRLGLRSPARSPALSPERARDQAASIPRSEPRSANRPGAYPLHPYL